MDNRIEEAGRLAGEYFEKGYHCSESIIRAVPKAIGLEISDDVIRAACAFFGGGGGTGGRCGVIESSLILISMVAGRDNETESVDDVKALARELMPRFKEKFKYFDCKDVKFSEVSQFGREFGCRRVYVEGAKLAAEILIDYLNQKNL